MAVLIVFTFAACSGSTDNNTPPVNTDAPTSTPAPIPIPTPEPTPTPNPELTDSLEDIIKIINAAMDPELIDHLVSQEINADNAKYFLGTDKIEFTEALASEPMIGVMPHSVVVLRVAEGTDVEAAVEMIKANADGRKWICVGVDDEDVLVNSGSALQGLFLHQGHAALLQIQRA